MDPPLTVTYRTATAADVPGMAASRAADRDAGPADNRMEAYLRGRHHPRHARAPRTAFVASVGELVIGYVGGHLSDRFGCEAEVQYLYVTPAWRRQGVGRSLLSRLGRWFLAQEARRICVDVNPDSPEARPFYQACGAQPLNRAGWMVWPDIGHWLDARQL